MLGEHESRLNQSLRRPIPPVRSLLGPIFLPNILGHIKDPPAWRPREKACSAHLTKGPGFPNTFSSNPTLCWSQQPSLGSSSFGTETQAPGFLQRAEEEEERGFRALGLT